MNVAPECKIERRQVERSGRSVLKMQPDNVGTSDNPATMVIRRRLSLAPHTSARARTTADIEGTSNATHTLTPRAVAFYALSASRPLKQPMLAARRRATT